MLKLLLFHNQQQPEPDLQRPLLELLEQEQQHQAPGYQVGRENEDHVDQFVNHEHGHLQQPRLQHDEQHRQGQVCLPFHFSRIY